MDLTWDFELASLNPVVVGLAEDEKVVRRGGTAVGGGDEVVNLKPLLAATEEAGPVTG
jgi:hypothetical protein